MRVGWIGLGKLGMPVAVALKMRGHSVLGYDANRDRMNLDAVIAKDHGEAGWLEQPFADLVHANPIEYAETLEEVVQKCEMIFLAVQTPHDARYEGVTRLPAERVDFDYGHLVRAARAVSEAAGRLPAMNLRTLVIVSTVLPGTIRREVQPVIGRWVRLVYNPAFIAMGTTIRDYLAPEFVLLGGEAPAVDDVAAFYEKLLLNGAPIRRMSIESAELTKVAYNVAIGLKIVQANALMEICEAVGADVDDVTSSLALATDRLVSARYMIAGMGDGGGCHPRDGIALSALSRRLGLSYDLFEATMLARERQTEWLARQVVAEAHQTQLPIVILGYAYKPGSALTAGSPALLLRSILQEWGHDVTMYDPVVDAAAPAPDHRPAVFVIGCRHKQLADFPFPPRSVVVDPHRYIVPPADVRVRALGRNA